MIKLHSLIPKCVNEGVITKGYNKYPEIEKKVLELLNDIIKGKPSEDLVFDFNTEFSAPVKLKIKLLKSDGYDGALYSPDVNTITLNVPSNYKYEKLVGLVKNSLGHEFDHFLQHSFSLDKKYRFGLEKNKIKNKKLDFHGLDKKTGQYTFRDFSGRPSDYEMFSDEYKPWLRTHVVNFRQLVPNSLPLKIQKQLFSLYVGLIKYEGYDSDELKRKLDPELFDKISSKSKYSDFLYYLSQDKWKKSLHKIKIFDFPRWKQMVKEMYKELFK